MLEKLTWNLEQKCNFKIIIEDSIRENIFKKLGPEKDFRMTRAGTLFKYERVPGLNEERKPNPSMKRSPRVRSA